MEMIEELRRMKFRQICHQTLTFAMIVCSALMIWKSLMVITNTESPIVVVLTESMVPAFNPGDLLFLVQEEEPVRVGDIVVFTWPGKDIPIVHRVMHVHDKPDGKFEILTKGDNNQVDDRGLYPQGTLWLTNENIVGKVKGYLPFIGKVTIIMNENPSLKFALIGIMGLFVIVKGE